MRRFHMSDNVTTRLEGSAVPSATRETLAFWNSLSHPPLLWDPQKGDTQGDHQLQIKVGGHV
jgi:hypothetical protein